jgi:two-component system, NarL family, sensor histidine kinase UhpB
VVYRQMRANFWLFRSVCTVLATAAMLLPGGHSQFARALGMPASTTIAARRGRFREELYERHNGSLQYASAILVADPAAWTLGHRPEATWIAISFLEMTFVGLVLFQRRKRSDEALIAVFEEQFRYVFEQPLIGMAFEDMNGKLLRVNSQLCSMLGFSEDEMLTMDCKEFAHPDDEVADWELFQEIQAGIRSSYHIEKKYRRKDGTKMWGRLHVCRLNSEGNGPPRILAMVEDITEGKLAEQKLSEAQRNLEELTSRLIQAQEDERRRIARELHDDFGQRLSLLMMEMERINRELPAASPEKGALSDVLIVLDELTGDVHELSHQLHSRKLQYIGLKPALRELCQQFAAQSGIAVSEVLEDAPDLPADVRLCLYRIAQEALRNVGKHSRARQVLVQFSTKLGIARLKIKDDGVGFDPGAPANGIGMASMRERLRMVEGDLTITSRPGHGTELVAIVPRQESTVVNVDKVA